MGRVAASSPSPGPVRIRSRRQFRQRRTAFGVEGLRPAEAPASGLAMYPELERAAQLLVGGVIGLLIVLMLISLAAS